MSNIIFTEVKKYLRVKSVEVFGHVQNNNIGVKFSVNCDFILYV